MLNNCLIYAILAWKWGSFPELKLKKYDYFASQVGNADYFKPERIFRIKVHDNFIFCLISCPSWISSFCKRSPCLIQEFTNCPAFTFFSFGGVVRSVNPWLWSFDAKVQFHQFSIFERLAKSLYLRWMENQTYT